MKEPPAASHLAREAHPVTASTPPWAVQCGCADYVANIVAIETTSPEEACVRTIEEANASDGWKRLDDFGLTFVHALAPGDVNNPWSCETYGSVLPVPEQYTENGKEARPSPRVRCLRGGIRRRMFQPVERSRKPTSISAACCSAVLTGTKRMVGRLIASHSASASAASFLPRLT